MNEDSPKIVNLETSLELSEFPSEAEFPSEVGPQPETGPSPAVVSLSAAAPSLLAEIPPPPATARIEPTPFVHAPLERVATFEGVAEEDAADTDDEPLHQTAHAGPATVTEFPVRPHTPAAVALPSLPLGPATLVDLLERRGGFDWRESVAVIRQICLYLRDHSPQAPILLDPRNIQITEKGEVNLLSGQTSSDPLVIQVGRLLRTMLMGKEAPPELRLLLSQATFELPIFESIEDVDRALAQLNKLDEPGPAGLALLRAVAAPPPPPNPEDDFDQPAASDSLDPPSASRDGTPGSVAIAVRITPGRLRVTRGRHLRRDCGDWRTAVDAAGDPLPQRRIGHHDRRGGADRNEHRACAERHRDTRAGRSQRACAKRSRGTCAERGQDAERSETSCAEAESKDQQAVDDCRQSRPTGREWSRSDRSMAGPVRVTLRGLPRVRRARQRQPASRHARRAHRRLLRYRRASRNAGPRRSSSRDTRRSRRGSRRSRPWRSIRSSCRIPCTNQRRPT